MKKLFLVLTLAAISFVCANNIKMANHCYATSNQGGGCAAHCSNNKATCTSGIFTCSCTCGTTAHPFNIEIDEAQLIRYEDFKTFVSTNQPSILSDVINRIENVKNAVNSASESDYEIATSSYRTLIASQGNQLVKDYLNNWAIAEGIEDRI